MSRYLAKHSLSQRYITRRDETRRKAFESGIDILCMYVSEDSAVENSVYLLLHTLPPSIYRASLICLLGSWGKLDHILKTTPVLLHLTLETWHLLACLLTYYHRYCWLPLLPSSRPPNGEQNHLGTVRRV